MLRVLVLLASVLGLVSGPLASERKSWSLTSSGLRSHFQPHGLTLREARRCCRARRRERRRAEGVLAAGLEGTCTRRWSMPLARGVPGSFGRA